MRTKLHILIKLVLVAHLIALLVMVIYVDKQNVPNTLFIIPKQAVNDIIDYEALEEKNGEDFYLSYETNTTTTLHVLNSNHEVSVKGTNYLYATVMNRQLISGSFFTKEAQEAGRRLAVLNKTAAFELFGSYDIWNEEIQIDGEIFTVTGVVDDKDKKSLNIYIPQCFSEKSIESIAAMFESNDGTPVATIENELKQFNISSKLFNFYNFNEFADGFAVKLLLALHLTLLIYLVFYILKLSKKLTKHILRIKEESELLDPGELLYQSRRQLANVVFCAIMLAALALLVIVAVNRSMNYILQLRSVDITMVSQYTSGLPRVIYTLNELSMYSLCIFISFLVLSALNFVFMIMNVSKQKLKTHQE